MRTASPEEGSARTIAAFSLRVVGVVPYYVGATHGPRGLREALERTGFEVLEMTAVMHCPRVVAVAIAAVVERLAAPELRSRFLGILAGFERLEGWPTRSCTGHFVAALAQKPASGRPRRRLG